MQLDQIQNQDKEAVTLMGQAKARGNFETRKAQAIYGIPTTPKEAPTGYGAFKVAMTNHSKEPERYAGPGSLPISAEQFAVAIIALDKLHALAPASSPAPVFSPNGDVGGLWVKENAYLSWECRPEGHLLWALSVNKKLQNHGHWMVHEKPSLEFVQALAQVI